MLWRGANAIKYRVYGSLTRARPGVWATFARPGADNRPPPPTHTQRTRKLRKVAKSGKRRSISRGKFYKIKKCQDHFLIRSTLRSHGVKMVKFSQNRAIFSESRNTASFKEFGSLMCLWQALKLWKMQLEVRSLNVTWRRDLWGKEVKIFRKYVKVLGK